MKTVSAFIIAVCVLTFTYILSDHHDLNNDEQKIAPSVTMRARVPVRGDDNGALPNTTKFRAQIAAMDREIPLVTEGRSNFMW